MQINSAGTNQSYSWHPLLREKTGAEGTNVLNSSNSVKNNEKTNGNLNTQNSDNSAEKNTKSDSSNKKFTIDETQKIATLKKRDTEVRAHELAHIMAGGGYIRGGAQFSYQKGPDGKSYAVGGEVSIDSSSISGNPEATARKMQVVRNAALAPANPSGQDRMVAAKATQLEISAKAEVTLQQVVERSQSNG